MKFLREELNRLKEKNLERHLESLSSASGRTLQIGPRHLLNFSSNNYLGLANHPEVKKESAKALQKWGTGSGASRLISGNLKIHEDLETCLAVFKKEEAATVFSSGYLANLGAVTALADEQDLVLVDRLNHASLIDAARLSKAKLWVYPHRDMMTLSRLLERGKHFRRRWVLTDSYFSMEGTVAPLHELWKLCRKHGAYLMIDEAHSTGVFGKNGAGLSEHFALQGKIDVVMGTLSKALGSVGGFIAGQSVLKEYLINRSREFIYTTAPSPAASAAASAAIHVIQTQGTLRRRLWQNSAYLRKELLVMGFDLKDSEGPIIPLYIGETSKTIRMRDFLKKMGIFAAAIRPPTVPKNTDRIRLSLTAEHTEKDIQQLLGVLKKAKGKIL